MLMSTCSLFMLCVFVFECICYVYVFMFMLCVYGSFIFICCICIFIGARGLPEWVGTAQLPMIACVGVCASVVVG